MEKLGRVNIVPASTVLPLGIMRTLSFTYQRHFLEEKKPEIGKIQ